MKDTLVHAEVTIKYKGLHDGQKTSSDKPGLGKKRNSVEMFMSERAARMQQKKPSQFSFKENS
jgi:hypothetical protein